MIFGSKSSYFPRTNPTEHTHKTSLTSRRVVELLLCYLELKKCSDASYIYLSSTRSHRCSSQSLFYKFFSHRVTNRCRQCMLVFHYLPRQDLEDSNAVHTTRQDYSRKSKMETIEVYISAPISRILWWWEGILQLITADILDSQTFVRWCVQVRISSVDR